MPSDAKTPVTGLPRGLRRLAEISRAERRLFFEAVLWLGLSRLVLLTVPFRRLAPHLGPHMTETPPGEETPGKQRLAREVARAVIRASRHVPWEAKCLVQAMAGKKMLRRRGVESTLYLGVAKTQERDEQGLEAHAWLRCGDRVILGGGGLRAFTVVSTFGGGAHERTSASIAGNKTGPR